MEIIAIFLFFIGLLGLSFVWSFKKDKYWEDESKRCLNSFCERPKDWNSNGKVFSTGVALIIKDKEKKFVKQSKLKDIGILD